MDGQALRQWLAVLDSLSYYQLFRVEPKVGHDDLRVAFHDFADSFHPDSHHWRHPNEQAAIVLHAIRGMARDWTPASVIEHALPALAGDFTDLGASGSVFTWDAV